jgi:prepilin-type N-terminal cleavage/methylation domain-containing protein
MIDIKNEIAETKIWFWVYWEKCLGRLFIAIFVASLHSGIFDSVAAEIQRPSACKENLAALSLHSSNSASKSKQGFTLVELLVVTSILGVLVAILLPALHKAKKKARRIQCMNNEKQLATASLLYAMDNEDHMPANGDPTAPDANPKWVMGAFVRPLDSINESYVTDPNTSLFGKYIHNPETYVCPEDPPKIVVGERRYPRVRSYALNNYVGWDGIEDHRLPLRNWKVFMKSSDFESPSDSFLFLDVDEKSICFPFFGVYMAKSLIFNFPSHQHEGGGVSSFADGHIDYHRWKDSRTLAAFSEHYHYHDEPAYGNPDLEWLQSKATSPK